MIVESQTLPLISRPLYDFGSGGSLVVRSACASNRPLALDLHAVQLASRRIVERVAAMHEAAVIPHEHVAHPPLLAPHELGPRRMRPQFVEEALAFVERQADDVCVRAAPEIQCFAARQRIGCVGIEEFQTRPKSTSAALSCKFVP